MEGGAGDAGRRTLESPGGGRPAGEPGAILPGPGSMMKKVLIFGYPLKRTLSPVFQNRGFKALGLDWTYGVCPIAPAGFDSALKKFMADPSSIGANVTIPHKQAALRLKGVRPSPTATAIGAANTLYRRGNRWCAENTDAAGFL